MSKERFKSIMISGLETLAKEVWKNDDSTTKFKMGQKVFLVKENIWSTIIGINVVDENSVEYALNGLWHLVWEDELQGE